MLNLEQWLNSLKPSKAKPGSGALAVLQFDSTGMGLLRVQPEGESVRVLSHATQPGAWHDDASMGAALRAFAAEHILPGDSLYSILPRYDITLRLLELPSQDDAEIDGMLHLNAGEHVPYADEDLLIRHSRLYNLPGGESMVLAVFARANVVDAHVALLQGAGLEPEQIFLSTACLLSSAATTAPAEPERFALVHVASGGMEVVVFDARRPVYVRGVSMPHGWSLPEEGSAPEELITELRASLSSYRRESIDGMGVEQLYLSADTLDPAELVTALEMETGKDCSAATFLRTGLGNAEAVQGALPAALFGGALAAVGKARYAMHLLPEHVRQSRQMTGLRVQALRVAVVLLVALVASGVVFAQRVWQYNAYISELEAQVKILAPQAEGVAEKQAALNIIARQVAREGNVLEQLGAVAAALPEDGINLTRMAYERPNGMEVWGRALTTDNVADFTARIRAAGTGVLAMLETAHRMYEQKDVEREQPVIMYHVAIPTTEVEGEALDEVAP